MTTLITAVATHSPFSERFVKFALVGVSGVAINTIVLFLLHGPGGLPLPVASVVSIEAAIVNNFLWNDRWTFHRRRPSITRFVRFNAVAVGGLGVNLAVLTLGVEMAGIHYLIANLAGILAGLAWNFAVNVRWTWRSQRPPRGRLGRPTRRERSRHE